MMNKEKIQLADRQNKIINSIFEIDNHNLLENKAIKLYRLNLIFTASRALKVTYPVLTQLIGEEALNYLAKKMLVRFPPDTGDWADWGEHLTELILNSPLYQKYPYLTDMATLEWKMHLSGRAPYNSLNISSLNHLKTTNLNNLSIVFSPAVHLVTSQFPIAFIWRLHKNAASADSFFSNKNSINSCQLIIHQKNNTAVLSEITNNEFSWIQKAIEGKSIGSLLNEQPDFDFICWISSAIQMNLITNLKVLPTKNKGEYNE